jgi:hypothetical protein
MSEIKRRDPIAEVREPRPDARAPHTVVVIDEVHRHSPKQAAQLAAQMADRAQRAGKPAA